MNFQVVILHDQSTPHELLPMVIHAGQEDKRVMICGLGKDWARHIYLRGVRLKTVKGMFLVDCGQYWTFCVDTLDNKRHAMENCGITDLNFFQYFPSHGFLWTLKCNISTYSDMLWYMTYCIYETWKRSVLMSAGSRSIMPVLLVKVTTNSMTHHGCLFS